MQWNILCLNEIIIFEELLMILFPWYSGWVVYASEGEKV